MKKQEIEFRRFGSFLVRYQSTKKGAARQPLGSCTEIRVDESPRKIMTNRHDLKFITLTSGELIAKEARYHPADITQNQKS